MQSNNNNRIILLHFAAQITPIEIFKFIVDNFLQLLQYKYFIVKNEQFVKIVLIVLKFSTYYVLV